MNGYDGQHPKLKTSLEELDRWVRASMFISLAPVPCLAKVMLNQLAIFPAFPGPVNQGRDKHLVSTLAIQSSRSLEERNQNRLTMPAMKAAWPAAPCRSSGQVSAKEDRVL